MNYTKCDAKVTTRLRRMVDKHHKDLAEAEVHVGCLFAETDDGEHAVKLHGYPCIAIVKKIPLKQRVHGMPDAEITIDLKSWEDLSDEEQDAVLDHELEHLEVIRDKHKQIKRDAAGRPQLNMRLHDWQLGGFASIAKRHGDQAIEVQAARTFQDQYGQYVFGFAGAR